MHDESSAIKQNSITTSEGNSISRVNLRSSKPASSRITRPQRRSGLSDSAFRSSFPSKGKSSKKLAPEFIVTPPDDEAIGDNDNEEAQKSSPSNTLDSIHAHDSIHPERNQVSSGGDGDLRIRVRLIERQLQDANVLNSVALSSSAESVILSLKWAFLKVLEKPLKKLDLPGISQNGVAHHSFSVTVQCDYFTFREIAASIAKEHSCSTDVSSGSRVGFSPSFSITQSGSIAANDMNILFACLADLTTFLRIRDDNDFESILSKEVVSEASTIMRILGTFNISNINDICEAETAVNGTHANSNHPTNSTSKATNSVCASSESTLAIRLFVGTSPINYLTGESSQNFSSTTSRQPLTFESTIFQQECSHFCSIQKCFRTPWSAKQIRSDLSVNCTFDLDGTLADGEMKDFFVMNWKRQVPPSRAKWTIDVLNSSNNTPGSLCLIIPVIYVTSSTNVQSLVSLLDNYIETFMKVRSQIHNQSSFK